MSIQYNTHILKLNILLLQNHPQSHPQSHPPPPSQLVLLLQPLLLVQPHSHLVQVRLLLSLPQRVKVLLYLPPPHQVLHKVLVLPNLLVRVLVYPLLPPSLHRYPQVHRSRLVLHPHLPLPRVHQLQLLNLQVYPHPHR